MFKLRPEALAARGLESRALAAPGGVHCPIDAPKDEAHSEHSKAEAYSEAEGHSEAESFPMARWRCRFPAIGVLVHRGQPACSGPRLLALPGRR
jgi:hypothetical protein